MQSMEEKIFAKLDEILESISGLKTGLDRLENAYESSQQQINDLIRELTNRCDRFENDQQERVKVSDFKELQDKLDKTQTKQREDYKLLASQQSQLDRQASKMKDYFQSAEKENPSREAYSKRFNPLVHGLKEQSDSAWEKRETTENILRKFLADGLKIDHSNDISIVDLHRLPQYPLFKNNVKLNRSIILKLSNNYDKQLIMSRLKLLKDYDTTRKNANPTASKIDAFYILEYYCP